MNKRRRWKAKRRRVQRCRECSGIYGSHEATCQVPWKRGDRELVCWRCRRAFPIHWACSWSSKGSSHLGNCRAHRAFDEDVTRALGAKSLVEAADMLKLLSPRGATEERGTFLK